MVNILAHNKIDLQLLQCSIARPAIFTKGTDRFWDDEYISGQMLAAHLNPDLEAASKTAVTIAAETRFIMEISGMDATKSVLDLGCGPGLYVREFARTGAWITGIDLSPRSINYANTVIKPDWPNTSFVNVNYLHLDYKNDFDVATLIFYDFCALNPGEQSQLLTNIHRALKPDGVFIFDIVNSSMKTSEATSISVCEGGFWSPRPYIEIYNTHLYEQPKTEGRQYTIIEESGDIKVIRLYHRLFNLEEITDLLVDHHFRLEKVYNNLKGDALIGDSETFGLVARKV